MRTREISVLLVDDCEEDVELMARALREERLPVRLDIAYNGEEALQKLDVEEKDYPDIILLDLNMPRINGHQVLQRLKNHETLKKIPVIVLTTSRSPSDIARCYDNHGNCFICKPLDFDAYFSVVEKIKEFWLELAELPYHSRWMS